MKTVSIAGVTINIHNGSVGISCSGGADSSLLLYILMKYSSSPIHVFTCVLDDKNRSSVLSSTNVIKKCIDLTGNYNISHHLHFVKSGKSIDELFRNQSFFLQNKIIDILYTGITSNPPLEIQDTFSELSLENHERHPDVKRMEYIQGPVYMPFTNVNKKIIAKMYTELGLTDSLYPVTRSCESTTLTQGHCGQCWWCQERNWGFGKL
jgi:7-cyano-7-deazaguanine synthase in queuosine biosynthesis